MIQNKATDLAEVAVEELVPNPRNRNHHPEDQILRLAKIIEYQGFRNPVIVSKRSGHVVAGHGRLEAAKLLGMPTVPVLYQEFESEEQEYAAQVSDNAIAAWSELDLAGINADLPDLGPDFDIDVLGIDDFTLDVPSVERGEEEPTEDASSSVQSGDSDFTKIILNYRVEQYEDLLPRIRMVLERRGFKDLVAMFTALTEEEAERQEALGLADG